MRDQNCEICGISGELEDISSINQLLEENVEPFIKISIGMFCYSGKNIGYFKIYENNNRPYVIKKEISKGVTLKKGDIYIRKGATVFKAQRNDLDFMYRKMFRKQVALSDNILSIKGVNGDSSFEAGNIQIQFINESDMSLSFKLGYVTIENQFGKIERMLFNSKGIPRLDEKPYKLKAKTQKLEHFLFEFESGDCIRLNFDENGSMHYPTKAKVTFIDIEENEYSCALTKISLIAKEIFFIRLK